MRSLTRVFVTGALAVLILTALWWSRADKHQGQASVPARHLSVVPPAKAVPLTAPLAAHQPKPVIAKLDRFDTWLSATFAKAEPTFLGVDCGAMPCLIAVRFAADKLSEEELRVLVHDVPSEIERRVGFAMAVVHSDQDRDGLDYLWMYGLPSDLDAAELSMLSTSAEARYATRMDPLRADSPLADR